MQEISLEVFLSSGGVCLSVPRNCGLEQADALRVDLDNRRLVALSAGRELPLLLPSVSTAHCEALLSVKKLSVAEFNTNGVASAYQLEVQS